MLWWYAGSSSGGGSGFGAAASFPAGAALCANALLGAQAPPHNARARSEGTSLEAKGSVTGPQAITILAAAELARLSLAFCPRYHRPLMSTALPATEITALLGRGAHFEGKLSFDGRVRIDGSFRGEITSEDTLIVGDGAEVEAEIFAGTVIIKGGSVSGNVRAPRSNELYVPAKVSGTPQAPGVFMDKGVQFSGSCTMAPA